MHTAKQTQQDRDDAESKLRGMIKPGTAITTVLRHRSASGMTRSISAMAVVDGRIECLDFWVARVLGRRIDPKHGGVKCHGAGMDMGFELIYSLGRKMWPDGTPDPHGTRHGAADTDGGYALKHIWL
jgi:hypothetical protein